MNSSHWFHQWNPTHNIFDILLLCKYLPLNWYFYWADVQKAKTSQPPPPGPIWPHIYICKHPPNTARQTSAPLLDWRLLNWTFQTQHHSIFQFVSNIGLLLPGWQWNTTLLFFIHTFSEQLCVCVYKYSEILFWVILMTIETQVCVTATKYLSNIL